MIENGKSEGDEYLEEILNVLAKYGEKHPRAKIEACREYAFAVDVRILDPDFKGIDDWDRLDLIRSYLKPLSLLGWNHLGHLLLLTPAEAKKDPMNRDFEKLKASKRIIRPGKLKLPVVDEEAAAPIPMRRGKQAGQQKTAQKR